MSTIFLSVGQCGNQLANTFIDYAIENKNQQTSYLFTHYDDKFHFINLDSESKVIRNLMSRHGRELRSENVLNTKCGRGSNWASGYHGLEKDGASKFIESSLEAIRRESERCDFLFNFNVMHSLSGGTGSGCGSRMIEQLRDEYGAKKYVFTQSVAPFSCGELPLQHYNNLLCMSHLHEFVDGICLFQNDDVFNIIEKMQKDSTQASKTTTKFVKPSAKSSTNEQLAGQISLSEMNSYIIKSFLGAVSPVDSVSLKNQSIGMEFYELQRMLCSNPSTKIIELYNVNGTETIQASSNRPIYGNSHANNTLKSNPLLKSIINLVPKYDKGLTKPFVSINSLIIARGQSSSNELETLWSDMDAIKKCLNPVEWNTFPIDFWSSKTALNEIQGTSRPTNRTSATSLTFALNRNKCVEYLNEILTKAAEKYVQNAYLHWYSKFGIESDMFEKAFENVQYIIDTYKKMTL